MRQFIKTNITEFLSENNSSILSEDINNFLKNKNIIIDKYIESGTKGHIFLLENDNILKVTSHKVDTTYNDCKELVGKKNKYLVDILDCFKYNGHLFIVMEKLSSIKFNRWKVFDKPNSDEQLLKTLFLSFLNYDNDKNNIEDAIECFLNKDHIESEDLKRLIESRELDEDSIENILLDLDIMFEAQIELDEKYGLYLKDFHSGNIMESELTGEYKLIDYL